MSTVSRRLRRFRRRRRRRRFLARWTPRSVLRRMVVRMGVWGARLTFWGMRLAVRRLVRAVF
ncbi:MULTISPECIES: hypothetical protein [Streptomyces]|nr:MULTISPECIES: hypothetical protein [Streptomyces]AQT70690.1 hypothetical protein B1K54_02160 [Streptomyces sp. fd1-xmd]